MKTGVRQHVRRTKRGSTIVKKHTRNVDISPGFRRIRITKSTKEEDIIKFKKNIGSKINNFKNSKEYKNLDPSQKKKIDKVISSIRNAKTKKELDKIMEKQARLYVLAVSSSSLIAGTALVGSTLSSSPIIGLLSFLGYAQLSKIVKKRRDRVMSEYKIKKSKLKNK